MPGAQNAGWATGRPRVGFDRPAVSAALSTLESVNPLSFCTVRIEFADDDTDFRTVGTGFFVEVGEAIWLVTAGHNVTGRHADSGDPVSPWDYGLVPQRAEIAFLFAHSLGGNRLIRTEERSLALFDDDGSSAWRYHPDGLRHDVVAIRVEGLPADTMNRPVNDPTIDVLRDFPVDAGEDAFILGYPLVGERRLPLWKRATVATELSIDRTFFHVDSATRPGLSGGPVFARHSGYLGDSVDPDRSGWGVFYRFVGVYSGRVLHSDAEFQAQVGRVFKSETIDAVITNGPYWEPS
jgi:hypothetical protein